MTASFQRLAHAQPKRDGGAIRSRSLDDFHTIKKLKYRQQIVQALRGGLFADLLPGRAIVNELVVAPAQIFDHLAKG